MVVQLSAGTALTVMAPLGHHEIALRAWAPAWTARPFLLDAECEENSRADRWIPPGSTSATHIRFSQYVPLGRSRPGDAGKETTRPSQSVTSYALSESGVRAVRTACICAGAGAPAR